MRTQGQITQEFRSLTRIHGIPILSPTQNQRDSEDMTKAMTNKLVGDSYKKIRYTDFMYMIRMRNDKNFLAEDVRQNVVPKKKTADGITTEGVSAELMNIKDKLVDVLVPLEVKITKSKDSEKDMSRYLLFCKENLRIYNNIDEYIKDAPVIEANSSKLQKDINILTDRAVANVVTSDFINGSTFSNDVPNIFGSDSTTKMDDPFASSTDNPFAPSLH